jgi:RNA polymerase sigma-70 factor (ECF subfamily)
MATMGNDERIAGISADWIDAARRGDSVALGEALETFRDYLTLMAMRGIGPGLETKAGASDLVQETFLAAQRGVAAFRGTTQAEWRAWLEAILTNQLANLRRSYLNTQKRRAEVAVPPGLIAGMNGAQTDTNDPPSRHLRHQERDDAIEEALIRLPEHYRQVVQLHHDEGLTFEVIGIRMGISAEAVRKLWGRALVCLKQALGPDHDPR